MKHFFLLFFEISISTSPTILILLILSPFLNRRYASKWTYSIWIALAFRLLIPLNPDWPLRQIIIKVPEKITSPMIAGTKTAIPATLQAEQKFAGVTWLDFTAVLWLAAGLCFLLVHFLSFLHYQTQILKKGTHVENCLILRRLHKLRKDLRIRKKIDLITYSGAAIPMIIGFFRPVLVLPDYEYSQEELFFILKHELVHWKRHDLYFKLLFVIANAIHWFNPCIYIMRKEAGIDMELSCDEKVIQGTAYAVRKAYTEALLSSLCRQYKKPNSLTTQFYGGKQIMKKRFQNILQKSRKKNGLLILVCAVSITVFLGMITGCSIRKPDPSEPQNNHAFPASQTDHKEAPGEEPADNANGQTVPTQAPASEQPGSDSADNPEETLSEDGQEIKRIAEKFAAAYFSGDTDTIQSCLTSPCEWGIEVYEGIDAAGAGTISEPALKGLTDIGKEETGSTQVISLEFRDSNYEDMFLYLTIELIKQEDGWKIQFYGLEG